MEKSLSSGELWPEPLMQLNPSFAHGGTIDELVDQGLLHEECRRIFRAKKDELPGRGPARSRGPMVYGGNLFISPRGGFGQYLRRSVSLPNFTDRPSHRAAGGGERVLTEAVREC